MEMGGSVNEMGEINEISGAIVDAAMKVHSRLGPGLLENSYHKCLQYELVLRKLNVQSEVYLPVIYESKSIDLGYRLDLLVNTEVIVEVKAIQALLPIHHAQMLTYLKLAHKRLGLIINFNVLHLRDGIKRLAL